MQFEGTGKSAKLRSALGSNSPAGVVTTLAEEGRQRLLGRRREKPHTRAYVVFTRRPC
jgi:hypothetical protein